MNDLGPSAGLPDPSNPPPYPPHQAPKEAPRQAPRVYPAVGLTLTPGRVRNSALVAVGIPLLLVVVIGILAWPGSGGSGAGSPQGAPDGAAFGGATGSAQGFLPPTATPPTATPATTDPYGDPTTAYPTTTPSDTTPVSFPPSGTATPSGSASGPVGGPAATVEAYYAAINRHAFENAWRLGGENIDANYADFVSGFKDTERDTVTIVSVQGGRAVVTVDSLQTDGSHHTFSGSYDVSGGTITDGRLIQTG